MSIQEEVETTKHVRVVGFPESAFREAADVIVKVLAEGYKQRYILLKDTGPDIVLGMIVINMEFKKE